MSKRKRDQASQRPRKLARSEHARTRSSLGSNPIHRDTLNIIYPKVQSLRDYILDKLPKASRSRRKNVTVFDDRWPACAGFLDSTLIGVLHTPPTEVTEARCRELSAFTQTQRSASNVRKSQNQCDFDEVLGFVIWQLFQKQQFSRRPDHLLCHGYDRASSAFPNDSRKGDMTLPGILEQWPNSSTATFKQSPWSEVFSLLGSDFEAILSTLLLDCGIFMSLDFGKNNWFQLSGQPIYNVQPCNVDLPVLMNVKESVNMSSVSRKPGQINFVRSRMLYARASMTREMRLSLGLKHIHVFNRYQKHATALQDLHWMQYIFPRQFNFHNVFTSHVDSTETAQPWKDYTVRDDEIAQYSQKSRDKIPRRLRGRARQLINKIRTNHHRCSYAQILYHYTQRQLPTQLKLDDDFTPTVSEHLFKASNTIARSDRSFIPHAVPHSNVVAFCWAVLHRLLPSDVFGTGSDGRTNWTELREMVNRFVVARRFESFSLHEVVHGMRITTIDWLRPMSIRAGQKLSISDKNKRFELLYEFMYFLFDSLLVPLIRSNFYVTETAVHRNRLFYFRHDVWKKISEPSLTMLRVNMFESLNARQFRHTLENNKLGYSQMRLLPKENGARPITNLRRRPMINVNGKRILGTSVNAKLAPTFSVLNFERNRQPEAMASALFSIGDIGQKLKRFANSQVQGLSIDQPLFFVKMDIKSCFDTIPQHELLKLVHTILKEEKYRITKHVESKRLSRSSHKGMSYLSSRFISRANDQTSDPAFTPHKAEQLGRKRNRTLFTGTDHHRTMHVRQIQQMLNDHIRDNTVRIGRRHFKQVKGIPQGSVLSSLLCSFFYADFEHKRLCFLSDQSSLLLRLIDDFLLITTDMAQARMFVDAMSEGFATYGISINAEKSLVNFEATVQGHKIPRVHGTEYFPYCGLGIHMKSLELNKDRQRKDSCVENALTVDISGRAVTALHRRILTALKIQMHSMLLDTSHNSSAQIMTTVFECYVEATMKLHRYRINLPRSKRPGPGFMIALCQQMLDLGHKVLISLPSNDHASVQQIRVHQIGSRAMMQVLGRKQTEYRQLLWWLTRLQLQAPSGTSSGPKRLARIAQGGITPFQDYLY